MSNVSIVFTHEAKSLNRFAPLTSKERNRQIEIPDFGIPIKVIKGFFV